MMFHDTAMVLYCVICLTPAPMRAALNWHDSGSTMNFKVPNACRKVYCKKGVFKVVAVSG